jgi:hypothetical protein
MRHHNTRFSMSKREAVLTVSALARIHGRDRRTVERLLAGVKPARRRRVGGREFRYYRARDVGHLFGGPSVAEAFEELMGLRADLIEIKRSLRRREHIPVTEAQDAIAARIGVAQQRLVAMPGKLCAQLAGRDAKAQQALIDRELDEIEQELAAPLPWERK